jgi:endonuclease G
MNFLRIFLIVQIVLSFSGLSAQTVSDQIKSIQSEISAHEKALKYLSAKADSLKLIYVQNALVENGWPSEGEVIVHSAMALQYDEEHEMARWVAHIILPDVKDGRTSRTNDFRIDPKVKTGTAEERDYFIFKTGPDGKKEFDGFGFDRGHLAPSADFRWSQQALSESYYYSNMTPQRPEFNRESWAVVEDYVREYAIRNNTEIYVVTGPVLTPVLPKIDRSINKVSIPELHYKVAIDPKNKASIAFLMPNGKCEKPVESYVKSIDEIEGITGLDFFPALDAESERKLEATIDITPWLAGGDVKNVKLLRPDELEKGQYNTLQAYDHADTGKKVSICGTVVSTFKSKNNNVFINLDRRFPNAVFSINIWSSNIQNFSYQPEKELMDRKVCVRGEVTLREGIPQIACDSEKQIIFLDEL